MNEQPRVTSWIKGGVADWGIATTWTPRYGPQIPYQKMGLPYPHASGHRRSGHLRGHRSYAGYRWRDVDHDRDDRANDVTCGRVCVDMSVLDTDNVSNLTWRKPQVLPRLTCEPWQRYPECMTTSDKPTFSQRMNELAARAPIATFNGVYLRADTITQGKTSGPTKDAVARVEAGADVGKRITATRLVALGVFALAAKKQTGHVYLTIEGDGYDIAIDLPAKKEPEARKFAAKVNAAARA